MRRAALSLILCALAVASVRGQSKDATASDKPAGGVITGQVLGDGGQPIFNAEVQVYENDADAGWSVTNVSTDENGKFRAEGLGQSACTVGANARGYTSVPAPASTPRFYYAGDNVTIHLTRGGVLTGKVTRPDGEPVIATRVHAIRTRDGDGKKVSNDWGDEDNTDDRGVYRIYGLSPGTYIVCAGSSGFRRGEPPTSTMDDAPTYYVSAAVEGATAVTVRGGQEVGGIDIVYRGEKGHSASGEIAGVGSRRAWVQLSRVEPRVEISADDTEARTGRFEFSSLADGEYEVTANAYGDAGNEAVSAPVRFHVRGADVTGLRLTLEPLASVSGAFVLTGEPPPGSEATCPARSTRVQTEAVISLSREDPVAGQQFGGGQIGVGRAGAFKLAAVRAARYRMSVWLPDDGWYVQSIVRTEAGRKTPVDVGRDGLSVGAGQQIEGVKVAVSTGAARVAGRVTPAVEGQPLPESVRVYLVPAEPDAGDAVLRYYQRKVDPDGSFELKNVAPGAYRAIAVPDAYASDDSRPVVPAAWDAAKRAALRKAVAALPEVRLDPCARETSLVLHPTEVKALFTAPRAR